jgi:hypothetical protein
MSCFEPILVVSGRCLLCRGSAFLPFVTLNYVSYECKEGRAAGLCADVRDIQAHNGMTDARRYPINVRSGCTL